MCEIKVTLKIKLYCSKFVLFRRNIKNEGASAHFGLLAERLKRKNFCRP